MCNLCCQMLVFSIYFPPYTDNMSSQGMCQSKRETVFLTILRELCKRFANGFGGNAIERDMTRIEGSFI